MSGKTPKELINDIKQQLQTETNRVQVAKLNEKLTAAKKARVAELKALKGRSRDEQDELDDLEGRRSSVKVETGGARGFPSAFAAQAKGVAEEKMVKPNAPAPKSPKDIQEQAKAKREGLAGVRTEEEAWGANSTGSEKSRSRKGSIGAAASEFAAQASEDLTRGIMHFFQSMAGYESLPQSVRDYCQAAADERLEYLAALKPIKKFGDKDVATAAKALGGVSKGVTAETAEREARVNDILQVIKDYRENLVTGARLLKTDAEIEQAYTKIIQACRKIWVAQGLGDQKVLNDLLGNEYYEVKSVTFAAVANRKNMAVVPRDPKVKRGLAAQQKRQGDDDNKSVASQAYSIASSVASSASAAARRLKEGVEGLASSAKKVAGTVYEKMPSAPKAPSWRAGTSSAKVGEQQPSSPKQTTTVQVPKPPVPSATTSQRVSGGKTVAEAMAALRKQNEENAAKTVRAKGASTVGDPEAMQKSKAALQGILGAKPPVRPATTPVKAAAAKPQVMQQQNVGATAPKTLPSTAGKSLTGALGADVEKKVKGIIPRIKFDVEQQGTDVLDAINTYVGKDEDKVRDAVEKALGVTGSKAAIKTQGARVATAPQPAQKPKQEVPPTQPAQKTEQVVPPIQGGLGMGAAFDPAKQLADMKAKAAARKQQGGGAAPVKKEEPKVPGQKDWRSSLKPGKKGDEF